MSASLEYMKAKRTGFFPAFWGGGLLAAAVPVVNMAFRQERYLAQPGSPVQILLDANWQLMAMLNVLLAVAGACLLYDLEYAGNALQKMRSLPLRESSIFYGKVLLTSLMSFLMLAVEAGGTAFCAWHWFGAGADILPVLCRACGYSFLLMLPCVVLSLLIAERCRNMWISLGIGVICVFTATLLPTDSFVLSLFPFAMPFQVPAGGDRAQAVRYLCAAGAELVIFGSAEPIILKARRRFT